MVKINFIMTKEEALKKTKDKFTNLIDGSISPKATVYSVISYYESLIADQKPSYKAPISNIEANFIEDEINEFIDENEEYYD
jgi:hypothetical protein